MTAALQIEHLSKTFGGAKALDDVALSVGPQEVHGLLGQNGSGKSTLIKILAGYHAPDVGASLTISGQDTPLPLAPGEYRSRGLAFVHQQLGLVPSLSVLDNLRIGELATRDNWSLFWSRERRRAREIFSRFGLAIDPDEKVSDLPQVERALLAIVRAFEQVRETRVERGGGGILVLDEPTPFLPRAGVDRLFALVRQIVREGASVLFVSHDVDEVMEITDRATVLRDGRVAGTLVTGESTAEDFVEAIVGRKMQRFDNTERDSPGRAVDVKVRGLTGGSLRDVSFELRHGEVLGLTGLIGSGYDETPQIIFGASPAVSGRLTIGSDAFDLTEMTPTKATDVGIAFLPADRLGSSGVGRLSVEHNITLPVIKSFMKGVWLDRRAATSRAAELVATFDVRPADPHANLDELSGGNQQKALLAKWLQTKPTLLMLDEPTQGVDIGARQQVYKALSAASAQGAAILCASTDAEQLAAICHRVLIFSRGRVVYELTGRDVSKEQITERCYNSGGGGELRVDDEEVTG